MDSPIPVQSRGSGLPKDVFEMLRDLYAERSHLDEAIATLARLSHGQGKRSVSPPKSLSQFSRFQTPEKRTLSGGNLKRMTAAQLKETGEARKRTAETRAREWGTVTAPYNKMATPIPAWKEAYDEDDSLIYLLDRDLKIVRCNLAWDAFALANRGNKAVSSKVIGTCIMDVVPLALKSFYRAAYESVDRFKRTWWHVFECSSPTHGRVYQMCIMPTDGGCFLITSTLISEVPLAIEPPKHLDDYAGADGVARMCSNCRRIKCLLGVWEWIPEFLSNEQLLTTFDLCEFCIAYHYHVR
jgi:hypothetical protein